MEMIPWAFVVFASLFNVVLIVIAVWFASKLPASAGISMIVRA